MFKKNMKEIELKLTQIVFQIKNFLFPASCALCDVSLIGSSEIQNGLCAECEASISLYEDKKCSLCGKPLISETDICLPCRNAGQKSYDRIFTLFPYTGKYKKLLTEYKFKKNTSIANFFVKKIMDIFAQNQILNEAEIVPVPPRKGKIKEQGWDQVEYLVKTLEKNLSGHKTSRCLKRLKSKVQKNLNREERLLNLKGKIYLDAAPPKTALIIDDVITTGSTMEVCAKALKDGGAQKVYGLCLFFD